MNTLVKFCGITRREDAVIATRMGINAIGLVFYDNSPRAVSIAQAKNIIENLNPFLLKVGLFVNADPDYVHEVIEEVGLNLLQFHGDEGAQECEHYEMPYIKAISVDENVNLTEEFAQYSKAQGFLLDTLSNNAKGGTGEVFDWSLIPANLPKPIILAGGLNPNNVADAIRAVRPAAVDVSSGIEVGKGVKSPEKMAQFVVQVKKALIDQQRQYYQQNDMQTGSEAIH